VSIGSASAGPKCAVCTKTVYKMEELLVEGKIWHITCFTCGGGKPDTPGLFTVFLFHFGLLVNKCMYDGIGCKRVLKRDAYMMHEGDAYCHACYWDSRLFKPQGEAPAFGIHSHLQSSSIVVMNVCMYVCMIIRRRTSSFGGGATTGDCGGRCSRW
jgi:hypothetical protein